MISPQSLLQIRKYPAAAWAVGAGLVFLVPAAGAQSPERTRAPLSSVEREPTAPVPRDPMVTPSLQRAKELGAGGQIEAALALIVSTLESCTKSGDAVGEALAYVRRAELLERSRRKPEAAEAWAASARAWSKADYPPGSIEGWWRSSLALPINGAQSQEAITRAVVITAGPLSQPLAAAAACRRGARVLEAENRTISARRLYEAALEIYARCSPDSMDMARLLTDLGNLLRERGDLEPAAVQLRRALDIAERREASGHILADILNPLSVVYSRQARFTDAEKVRVREIELRRKHEPDSAALAHSLLNYALIFVRKGDDAQAERILQEALPLQEKRASGSLGHASTVEALGAVASRRGQWKTAERLHQQAYEIRLKHDPESESLAGSLVNLAVVRIQRADWAGAEQYLTRALEIRQKRQPDSLAVAHIRTVQATMAGALGDFTAARRSLELALGIYERRTPGAPSHAGVLMELGYLDYREGNLPAAWKQLAESVTLLEKESTRSSQLAIALGRLALVVAERGDFGVARTHLTRALSIYEQLKPRSLATIQTLTQLGRVAACEQQPAEARDYLERALKILQQTDQYPEAHARVVSGLAELSLAAGQPAEAAPKLAAAIAMLEKQKSSRLTLAAILHLQGECFQAQGRTPAAEAAYRKALDLWQPKASRSSERAQTLYHLALLLNNTPERRPEAARLATEAWSLLQQQSEGIAGDESLQAFVRLRAPVAAGVASLLVDGGQSEKPLQILEENRAQGLRHLLDEQRLRPAGVSDAAWQNVSGATLAREQAEENVIAGANALIQARHELSRVGSSERTAAEAAVLKQRVTELEEALNEAERGLAAARDRVQRLWTQLRSPGSGAAPRADFPLSLAHAKQAARDGSALLYYSVGEDRSLLFFIPPGTAAGPLPAVQVYPIPVSLTTLAAEVGGMVGAMREAQNEAVVRSRRLGERLFPAAVRAALARSRRVVVVPDGPLWELPFAALVVPGGSAPAPAKATAKGPATAVLPRFLGLEHPVSVTSSLSLFAERERSAPALTGKASLKVLAMGDPALPALAATPGAPSTSERNTRSMLPGPLRELGPIPATRADAQAVAQLYGVQPLLSESANEAAVRAALPDADVVHFATHGYLHPFWSRASGLVLSRVGQPATEMRPEADGLLQAWEIYDGLRLRADLVVLAACETGVGAISRGEGVNSLSRAFRAAGARSVVASLWKVRDDSTRRLMVAFHQRIRQGVAKDEALQLAMKELAARPGMRHPYHWGAFLLIGDRTNHLVSAPSTPPVSAKTARK